MGLASTLPVAHASKCAPSSLTLEFESIEGNADPSGEQDYWTSEAFLDDGLTLALSLGSPNGQSFELEPR